MEPWNASPKRSADFRRAAREALVGNWTTFVLLFLILGVVLSAVNFVAFIGAIISLIITGPMMLGIAGCFLKLHRKEAFSLESAFDGFRNFGNAFLVHLLAAIIIMLPSLIVIIPGVIAGLLSADSDSPLMLFGVIFVCALIAAIPSAMLYYSYQMRYYILFDNPTLKPTEVLKQSRAMMKGNKWRLFVLDLTFIGWVLLGSIPLFIGMLWVGPYKMAAEADFYLSLAGPLKKEIETEWFQEPTEPVLY